MSLLLALSGHAAISELSLLSGVKRKLDVVPAKGSFWRKAAVRGLRPKVCYGKSMQHICNTTSLSY
jgi:hypothetical protein